MRLHYVALPHTRVEPAFCGCAYTAKVLKFCKMMGKVHDIRLYAPYGPPVEGATLDPCLSDSKRQEIFGADDPARLPDWPTDQQIGLFNRNVIERIKQRIEPHDLILISGGLTHNAIVQAFPNHMVAEPGVGYEGICQRTYCAFESYMHMATVYAKQNIGDVRWFDDMIPNYFDPAEFPELNKGDGDYLLFLGRLIGRKGPHIAGEIAKAAGMPLVVAGAGCEKFVDGEYILATDGTRIEGDVHYIGTVGVEERAQVLAGAKALLVPTTYNEPFGGVAVEAMMAGTPAITSDFGAFTETVRPRVSGYRFRTLQEGVDAVNECGELNPSEIRRYAHDRYSLAHVGERYDEWFARLATLWEKGWYTRRP